MHTVFIKEYKSCNRLNWWITTVGENTSSNMHQTSWRYASYSDSNFYFTSSLISPLAGLMDHVMNQKNQKNKSWSPAVACSCTRRQPPYISWISNETEKISFSNIKRVCLFWIIKPTVTEGRWANHNIYAYKMYHENNSNNFVWV